MVMVPLEVFEQHFFYVPLNKEAALTFNNGG